ncbi:hypothetical protein [Xanthomonas arboricola]|uniref:hypothetical protein n=1 Tax=Xanthomonas arboricola TaxID=56448 RepID=UPI0011AF4DBD|nr:hypothetical protein [Xanthomonas arboricola]
MNSIFKVLNFALILAALQSLFGCSLKDKGVYGQLQALDAKFRDDKSALIISELEGVKAVRFRDNDKRVWWALNKLDDKEGVYTYPVDELRPGCGFLEEIDKIDGVESRVRSEFMVSCR